MYIICGRMIAKYFITTYFVITFFKRLIVSLQLIIKQQFFLLKILSQKKLVTTPFMQCSHSSVGFRAFCCLFKRISITKRSQVQLLLRAKFNFINVIKLKYLLQDNISNELMIPPFISFISFISFIFIL